MMLSQFLDFEAIRIDLAVNNKRQLINQLAQIAGARLSLDPAATAFELGAILASVAGPASLKR